IEPPQTDTLPPALPEPPAREPDGRPSLPPPAPGAPGRPIRLADSLALSLRNVETVQANLSVRTATVARFEALKAFIPLMDLPQPQGGLRRLPGPGFGQYPRLFPRRTRGGAAPNPAGARHPRPQPIQHLPATRPVRTHHRPADRRGRNSRQGADGAARPPRP